jgi:AraC-like DNA-binding protein/quercetin dioxygenase-like cupin family protein
MRLEADMNTIHPNWEKGYRVVESQINAEGTHLFPFDPAFPIDVRFFSFSGRNQIRMNRHHYCEIFHVTSGKTTLQVQDRLFEVNENDMVVIGGDLYHRTIDPPNCKLRLILLFFEPELIRTACGWSEEVEYLMPFFTQSADFPHVIPGATELPGRALDLILRIHEELPATTVHARLAVKTYLKMILLLLVKHYSAYLGRKEDIHRQHANLERLRPLFTHLERNFDSPILVSDAARLCAMSKSHFMWFFKRTTGQSFCSYVNHFRIAKAQDLLATTREPISSVSESVAFCNQSYFGMVFRKLVGVTPLAYRRQFANTHESECAVASTVVAARGVEGLTIGMERSKTSGAPFGSRFTDISVKSPSSRHQPYKSLLRSNQRHPRPGKPPFPPDLRQFPNGR